MTAVKMEIKIEFVVEFIVRKIPIKYNIAVANIIALEYSLI